MTWTHGVLFQEPLVDLRDDTDAAPPLAAELQREFAPDIDCTQSRR